MTNTVLIAGAFGVGSILMIWFNTSMPVHLTKLVRKLELHNIPDSSWPVGIEYKYWLRHDWETWFNMVAPAWLAELLTCPGCLSCHVSFWLSALLAICFGDIHIWLLGTIAWPAASNLILKCLKK